MKGIVMCYSCGEINPVSRKVEGVRICSHCETLGHFSIAKLNRAKAGAAIVWFCFALLSGLIACILSTENYTVATIMLGLAGYSYYEAKRCTFKMQVHQGEVRVAKPEGDDDATSN